MPRILVGNRLHLAFKRQVPTEQARAYAEKNGMTFFEVSPLCNFNVIESFTELSRIVLMRHGMEKFWRPNRGKDGGGKSDFLVGLKRFWEMLHRANNIDESSPHVLWTSPVIPSFLSKNQNNDSHLWRLSE